LNRQNFTVGLGLNKFFDYVVYHHRKKMFRVIHSKTDISKYDSILDIGSTSDTGKSSNAFLYFLKADLVTSISDQDITEETRLNFPHVNFVKGNGLSISYASSSYDFVFSNAVLEHVGDLNSVEKFISESIRVAKSKIILITPNRWFPLETHSKLLFIHWLPPKVFRFILSKIGMEFLSKEENLNLLSKSQLITIMNTLGISNFKLSYIAFMGYPSNIVVEIVKDKTFGSGDD